MEHFKPFSPIRLTPPAAFRIHSRESHERVFTLRKNYKASATLSLVPSREIIKTEGKVVSTSDFACSRVVLQWDVGGIPFLQKPFDDN